MSRAKGLLKTLPSRLSWYLKECLVVLYSSQRALLCRGNFLFSKSWKGSSRRLKWFWAISPVFRAERADRRFPVSAGEGPSSVNKVLTGTPLPDYRSGLVLNYFLGRLPFPKSRFVSRGATLLRFLETVSTS